jgi:hypothetical protein
MTGNSVLTDIENKKPRMPYSIKNNFKNKLMIKLKSRVTSQ